MKAQDHPGLGYNQNAESFHDCICLVCNKSWKLCRCQYHADELFLATWILRTHEPIPEIFIKRFGELGMGFLKQEFEEHMMETATYDQWVTYLDRPDATPQPAPTSQDVEEIKP